MTAHLTTPAPPAPTRFARALAVYDENGVMNMSPRSELDMAIQDYAERGVKVEAQLEHVFLEEQADGCDLIIFDWGGMSLGNSMMEHQIRRLVRYAEDHPSTLIAIRSAMCADYLKEEIREEELISLPNVLIDVAKVGAWTPVELPSWWVNGLKKL